jgi:ABC-2 type transport system ATP-binding protein
MPTLDEGVDRLPAPARAVLAGDATTADAAVVAVGLTKIYPGGATAVDGLGLTVRRGEAFALLGPNGAGKSTTVGMLTTSVVPTAGRAWVAGVDLVARPAAARREIGVVPQRNTLDRSLSVRENLVVHGRLFGMSAALARREADVLLERVALTQVAGDQIPSLSGGMAQRLMIARAVMHRPAVTFLDEPTAGLDPQSRLALHEIIRELRGAGNTIVLITHDMEEADLLADRVAIIDHGRLLALDTPAALKRSLKAGTVVTVVADAAPAVLAAMLREQVPGVTDVHVLADRVVLAVAGDDTVFPAVVAAADRAGMALRDVQVDRPTLETVFLRLTGKELRDR